MLGAMAATALTAAPTATGTPFYGVEIYNEDFTVYGLYEYTLDGTATLKHQLDFSVPAPFAGAFIRDGKYCYYTPSDNDGDGQYDHANYVEIDLTTGAAEVKAEAIGNRRQIVVSQALSPTDGEVYAFGYDYFGEPAFGTVDPWSGMLNVTTNLMTDGFPQFLSFKADGTLYAIKPNQEWSSLIMRFDPATGDYDVDGWIDGLPYDHVNGAATSAAIDPTTGLYAYHACVAPSAFYTIDPTSETGSLTQTAPYPGFGQVAEILGIAYAPLATGNAAEVPAAVTGLTIAGEATAEGGVRLTVAYTAPSTTADGATPLTGPVGVRLTVAGPDTQTFEEQDPAGEAVSHTYVLAASGQYTVTVQAHNEAGDGPVATASEWLGLDLPGAPLGLILMADTDTQTFTLAWDAPEGQHGGAYDAEALTYTVHRIVDGEPQPVAVLLKETTFTETTDYTAYTKITYSVTSMVGGAECGTVMAPGTYAVGSFATPVLFDLADWDQFNEFKVEDANGDACTWNYTPSGKAAQYLSFWTDRPADDWLFTPAIAVEAGKLYRIEFDDWCEYASIPERLEAKAGYAQSSYGMSEELVAAHTVQATSSQREHHTAILRPTQTGKLYVGIHALSDADAYSLLVSDISVSAPLAEGAPTAVTNATIASDPTGALQCTIAFDAPSLNIVGGALAAVSVRITRGDGTVVHDEAAQPGQRVTAVVAAENAVNTYAVVAYTEDGESGAVTLSCFAGLEAPAATASVTFAAIEGGHHIEWAPVTAGVTGGAVGEVTYAVIRSIEGNFLGDRVTGTETAAQDTVFGLSATSYDWLEDYADQGIVRFAVMAVGSMGQSSALWTEDTDIAGEPYELPFAEGFTDPLLGGYGFQNGFWGVTDNTVYYGGWTLAGDYSSDGDGHSAYFYNGYGDFGYEGGAMLYSGKINVADAEALTLSYDVYMMPEAGAADRMELRVSADRAKTWTLIESHDATEYKLADFRTFTADLSVYAGGEPIVLGFYASDAVGGSILLDNILLEASEGAGIEDVAVTEGSGAGVMYDLYGRRVERAGSGRIYVRDGKAQMRK